MSSCLQVKGTLNCQLGPQKWTSENKPHAMKETQKEKFNSSYKKICVRGRLEKQLSVMLMKTKGLHSYTIFM